MNILPTVTKAIESASTFENALMEICSILHDAYDTYDWVGYYMANHETKTLHLSSYVGDETDHTVIPFGKGICGQVADSNSTLIVPDVNASDNYIACSIHVKSEIVVPLFVDGKNVGQIDIDSHHLDAFSEEDQTLLEAVNAELAKHYHRLLDAQ